MNKTPTTLIIMDEIQEIPRGLHSLKYFCEKAPEYHIMVAGSLLGVTLGKGESFPVGKVDMLTMYPMDYEEYLDATGNENWIELLHSKDWGLIDITLTGPVFCCPPRGPEPRSRLRPTIRRARRPRRTAIRPRPSASPRRPPASARP